MKKKKKKEMTPEEVEAKKEKAKKDKERKEMTKKEQIAEKSAAKVRKHFDETMEKLIAGTAQTIHTVTATMFTQMNKHIADLMAPVYREMMRARKEEERLSGLFQCLHQVDTVNIEHIREERDRITKMAGSTAGALEELRKVQMEFALEHLQKHVRRDLLDAVFCFAVSAALVILLLTQAGII